MSSTRIPVTEIISDAKYAEMRQRLGPILEEIFSGTKLVGIKTGHNFETNTVTVFFELAKDLSK